MTSETLNLQDLPTFDQRIKQSLTILHFIIGRFPKSPLSLNGEPRPHFDFQAYLHQCIRFQTSWGPQALLCLHVHARALLLR